MSTTSTDLQQLRSNAMPTVRPGDDAKDIGFFNGASFNLTYRVATLFSQSTLVPKHYQDNPANCMIALNMAHRLGADPLMVMQNLYVVHGTPAWSAQFLIATFNMCGRFSALRYKWSGEKGKDDFGCTAVAVETSTKTELEGTTVTIALAKKEGWHSKNGSKWQTMPEQMLRYRAASWFVRAYAPEIAMGLHTAEEMYDMRQGETGIYEFDGPAAITTDEIKQSVIEAQADAPAGDDHPENETPITRETLDAVQKELTRLGAPDQLPPDLVARYDTGDPSELSEPQGKDALNFLKCEL